MSKNTVISEATKIERDQGGTINRDYSLIEVNL
jgi:hypothetical protein